MSEYLDAIDNCERAHRRLVSFARTMKWFFLSVTVIGTSMMVLATLELIGVLP